MVTSGRTLTINAGALTDTAAVLTFVGSNEADNDATVIVTGGAGNDLLTAGAEKSNFAGGIGIDTFTFVSANLTLSDTLSGGTGNDILSMSDNSTVEDSDFTNITSVEIFTQQDTNETIGLTLGALANASGLTTVTGVGTGADVVTVGAGFTNALRVNLGAGVATDTIDASSSAATLTVASNETDFTTADTIKGGSGSLDEILITGDGGNAAFGSGVTGFEKVTTVGTTAVQ
jgi:hypothetical protein